MLRRVISAVALVVLASTPVVARTRLFCRYTGLEIKDCTEQQVPAHPVVQVAGCCDGRVTRPLGAVRIAQKPELAPPTFDARAAVPSFDLPDRLPLAKCMRPAAAPAGPPVLLITRALLI